jgi:hypothetical protein
LQVLLYTVGPTRWDPVCTGVDSAPHVAIGIDASHSGMLEIKRGALKLPWEEARSDRARNFCLKFFADPFLT